MNNGRKIFTGIAALVVAAAIVGPPAVTNHFLQQMADERRGEQKIESVVNQIIENDVKFIAILPKLKLTETWQAVNTASIFENEITGAPWPTNIIYGDLPGYKSMLAISKERDAEEEQMVANKTMAKSNALSEARNICNIVKSSTPDNITYREATIELQDPVNLPFYLEYCGGDAASYQSALEPMIVQKTRKAFDETNKEFNI